MTVSWVKAKRLASLFKKRGDKIVFLSGVFDIIHEGHLEYIRRARKYGDHLFVGVEPDKWVKQYKGENRPLNSAKNRIKIISEFKSVDFVFEMPFVLKGKHEDLYYTKRLKELNPDIAVIWIGNTYWSKWKKQVFDAGVELRVVKYTSPLSTTILLRKAGLD